MNVPTRLRQLGGLAVVLAVAACSDPTRTAEQAVSRRLDSPASAQFRNVRELTSGARRGAHIQLVCGEVADAAAGKPGPFRKFYYVADISTDLGAPRPEDISVGDVYLAGKGGPSPGGVDPDVVAIVICDPVSAGTL